MQPRNFDACWTNDHARKGNHDIDRLLTFPEQVPIRLALRRRARQEASNLHLPSYHHHLRDAARDPAGGTGEREARSSILSV